MKRTIALLIVIGILFAFLSACAAAPNSAPSQATQPPAVQSDRAASGAKSAPAPGLSGAPAQPAAPSINVAPNQPSESTANSTSWSQMIIRNANLTLTVKSVEDSLVAIRTIADVAGGQVMQTNTRYEGERQVANITIQVPSSAFDASVSQLRQLAIKVETETSSTQDVTEEYTDLQSQLRNLQATEDSLLKLQGQATRIDDILRLQQELTNIRGQIERVQGRINYLSRRTTMSSISVSLLPEGAPRPSDRPIWSPLATAAKAWATSAVFLQQLADVLITLAVFFWWMVPVVVIFGLWLRSRHQRPKTAS